MRSLKINSADIQVRYQVEKYEKIADFLSLNSIDIQFLFSLVGFNNSNKIELTTTDDSPKSHTFSRTVFDKNTNEMERRFGLLTIVDSLDEPYNDVLNNKAFIKNSKSKEKYSSMPNVATFYQFLLGGIDPLNRIIFRYGADPEDTLSSIYEYLTEDSNEKIMDDISQMVK